MATRPIKAEVTASEPQPSPDVVRPALPALRFGLRQLFWTVTVLSLVLSVLAVAPQGPLPMLLLITFMMIAAHVAATALGSRLRRHAIEVHEWDTNHQSSVPDLETSEHSCDLDAAMLPPVSPWFQRGSNALRWLPRLVVVGAVLGGTGGFALFFLTNFLGRNPSLAGTVVGAVSLAVLGAWLAFVGGSFYAIFRQGLREAMAHQRSDESHTPRAR